MKTWHEVLRRCLKDGVPRNDRTGVGTKALFGVMLRFENVSSAFPAVTTKRLAFKQVAAELACFLRGYDNIKQFNEMGCTIWNANAEAPYWKPEIPGALGKIYGVQWRAWDGRIDQIAQLVEGIRKEPHGRRHVVTAWNPSDLKNVCLPPCHDRFQVFVDEGSLDIMVNMRSVDLFLGLPFDIASYGILLSLIAKDVYLRPRHLVFSLGDTHIYNNHIEQVWEVLSREPKLPARLLLAPEATLDNFHPSMVKLLDYDSHAAVSAPMAV